tara:strand:+ start:4091 stop:7090 length:3000 start_codon:yes stop_codon:yes gene_type:complete
MSARNFRFRSPGVRIEEIDESIIDVPVLSEVGPVIVGRSQHGPMLKPVTVTSVDEFTNIFGVPSAGGPADTDLWRGENTTAPDYGSYAAIAYLRNSAPVTFIRLGGTEHPNKTDDGRAGWQTTKLDASTEVKENGGAYGLWMFPSGSTVDHGTGSLAAVFYIDSGSAILMSGAGGFQSKRLCQFDGTMLTSEFKLRLTASSIPTGYGYNTSGVRDVAVKMDPGAGNFIRKAFNTSPILANDTTNGVQYPENYFLGETFEDYILAKHNAAGTYTKTLAFLSPLKGGSDVEKANYRFPFQPAKTGYVFSQDLGASASFDPIASTPQKLFRVVGLTEGSWASKNVKISISNISYTAIDQDADPYGTFNLEIRALQDSDDKPILLESFDNVNLNPRSNRYIGRVVGDQYLKWDDTNNKIEVYGEYPNQSRYVRLEVHPSVKVGGADPKLLPFGFLGPARRKKFQIISGSSDRTLIDTSYVPLATSYTHDTVSFGVPGANLGDGIFGTEIGSAVFTASLEWPDFNLRVSASNGTRGLSRNAYFGIRTSRTDAGRFYSNAYVDLAYPLEEGVDPWEAGTATAHAFAFSLDDVRQLSSSDKGYLDDAAYEAATRKLDYVDKENKASITARGEYYKAEGANVTADARYSGTGWKVVLDAGYNSFTMPMHAGFDGIDIKQKNPFSISNVSGGATTDGRANYAWFSVLTAIKQLRDPEYLDFNLAAVPGVVDATLNSKLGNYCQERGDSLALIDLDSGYRPIEDITANNISATSNRGTVSGAVDYRRNSISDVIHSYAATFYPWVDIADGRTNSVVSCPPTVAMMGVFGRVKQASEVWFAPAGFQRGGLSDGSTGLRILNVKDRLTSSERDELYDAGINPIANFPAEGIVVFGQKTLQLQRSALDRINVRRLMIYLKRQIGGVASRTLFEQNLKATWDNFTRSAVGILEEVKDGLGLVDYKFILDESTTTPDLVDQNILYAKLYVKPARAIEFIALDFIITRTGAEFPE